MTDIDRRLMLGLAGVAGAALATRVAQAGSLNPPPGPVTPTGKTTDQIEPRIDLLNAPASANVTSDADNHYIISNPGSYYLSANLAVTKTTGIKIAASGVTLDLCGFQVFRSVGLTGIGISTVGQAFLAAIGNGSFAGFSHGIDCGGDSVRLHGLRATGCSVGFYVGSAATTGATVESCQAYGNSNAGFICGPNAVFVNCIATSNGGGGFFAPYGGCHFSNCNALANTGNGFEAETGSTLLDCTASGNEDWGFLVGDACLLRSCLAHGNSGTGALSGGFSLSGSAAYDCVAEANSTTVTVTKTTGVGFRGDASDGTLIEGCSARLNTGDGFTIATGSTVSRCHAYNNGFAGVRATGSNNIIANNEAISNGASGIAVDGALSLVYGNCVRGGGVGVNYAIVTGNRVGTIVVPATAGAISGNTGGTAFTTDPYANIAF
jgi:parallel beta-helix repeat protein